MLNILPSPWHTSTSSTYLFLKIYFQTKNRIMGELRMWRREWNTVLTMGIGQNPITTVPSQRQFFSSCHYLLWNFASQGLKSFLLIYLVYFVIHHGGGCYLWCHILCLMLLGIRGKYSIPIVHSLLQFNALHSHYIINNSNNNNNDDNNSWIPIVLLYEWIPLEFFQDVSWS